MPGTVKSIRIINLLLAGALTSTQLNDALSTPLAAGGFEMALRQRTVADAIKASPTALKIIAASANALKAVLRQAESVFTVLIANTEATTALFSNAAAVTACLAFPLARSTIYNSDTLLTAIAGSATAKAAMRADASYSVISQQMGAASTPVAVAAITKPCIMLGWSCGSGTVILTLTGRRSGSTVGTLSGSAVLGATAAQDNVMALTGSVQVSAFQTSATAYFGVMVV